MNIYDIEKKIVEKNLQLNEVEVDIKKIRDEIFSEEKYSDIIADRDYVNRNIGFFSPKVFNYFQDILNESNFLVIGGFKSGNMCYVEHINSDYFKEDYMYLRIWDDEAYRNNSYGNYSIKYLNQYCIKRIVIEHSTNYIYSLPDEIKITTTKEIWNNKKDSDVDPKPPIDPYTNFLQKEQDFFIHFGNRIKEEMKKNQSNIIDEIKLLEREIEVHKEQKIKNEIEERNREELEIKRRIQENYHNFRKISQERIDKIKEIRNDTVIKYDVDGNELVDDVEENVFVGIIRNNNEVLEKKIGIDKVHKLVKLSIYLGKKRDNIQNLFGCLLGVYNDFYKKEEKQEICIAKVIEESYNNFTTNISEFYFSNEEESTVIDIDKALYNELNTYKTMLFHSTSMVVSAKKGDLITFFEIYEVFDKLGVFDSNWENEVSKKLSEVSNKLSYVSNELSEISNKLSEVSNKLSNLQTGIGVLIQSINKMNDEIVGELISLNYVMESSFESLETSVNYELQGIKSSLKFNNLLTSVNTYQLSKSKQ